MNRFQRVKVKATITKQLIQHQQFEFEMISRVQMAANQTKTRNTKVWGANKISIIRTALFLSCASLEEEIVKSSNALWFDNFLILI